MYICEAWLCRKLQARTGEVRQKASVLEEWVCSDQLKTRRSGFENLRQAWGLLLISHCRRWKGNVKARICLLITKKGKIIEGLCCFLNRLLSAWRGIWLSQKTCLNVDLFGIVFGSTEKWGRIRTQDWRVLKLFGKHSLDRLGQFQISFKASWRCFYIQITLELHSCLFLFCIPAELFCFSGWDLKSIWA